MQNAWLYPLLVAAVVGLLILTSRPSANSSIRLPDNAGGSVSSEVGHVMEGRDVLSDLVPYVDPDFGFTMAIPGDWTPVVALESDADLARLEPGYAVGFESPQEHAGDVFTDYLMVEILPGDDVGLFVTDGSLRRDITIDGRSGFRDRLSLPASAGGTPAVDLVVHQATIAGLGYTVGLYAIGEPKRDELIEHAFEAMLRTFRIGRTPFKVS